MKIGGLLIAVLLWCIIIPDLAIAQGTSNKGTDFWLPYANHVSAYGNNSQKMVLYITSDVSTMGSVSFPGTTPPTQFNITANQIQTIDVPQSAYVGNTEGISPKAIHVTSVRPIVVYAHIYNANISGASLVLPTNTLGKDYISINYDQVSNADKSFSFIEVVAVEDNTQIIVTPSADTEGGLQKGVTSAPINLKKGDVYQILGKDIGKSQTGNRFLGTDLTGTVIRSVSTGNEPCKRIAVFSGSGKVSIGCLDAAGAAGSADNLFQQVYPTSTWGKNFVTVPLKSRNYDIFRIVKSDPTAIVKLNGTIIPNADFINNLYYEFPSQANNIIESDKPIQVAQYAVTQGKSINCTNISGDVGDPEMIFLNPLEQTLTHITMYSTSLFNIVKHFINVVIQTDGVASFKLDGQSVVNQFNPVPSLPGYSFAQFSVNAGTHNMSADFGFNAIAYGFGSAESYGYAAGANLVSKGIEAKAATSGELESSGCISESYNFTVSLPYEPANLTLDSDNGLPPASIPINLINKFQENGKQFYQYQIMSNVTFTRGGTYKLRLISRKPNFDSCGSDDEFDLDFNVYDLPKADFSVASEGCETSRIQFTDNSISKAEGISIKKWNWDFGDDSTSTEQNPKHAYARAGKYTVKLSVQTETGCSSDVLEKEITIFPAPNAKFTAKQAASVGCDIIFTDQSPTAPVPITKWEWEMGDGTHYEKLDNTPFTHRYAAAGTYKVAMKTVSDRGCVSDWDTRKIVVYEPPVVDFEVPKICLQDGLAEFKNKTDYHEYDDNHRDYDHIWDFGDPASPGTSDEHHGKHVYTLAGTYRVTLTAFIAGECPVSVTKEITVSGSNPHASFDVIAEDKLCSNREVAFKNTSSVAPGNITKLEWYFDFANKPTQVVVDENPEPGKKYTYLYDAFNTPGTKTFQVKVVAYSGTVCKDESAIKTITLMAAPEVKFDALMDICLNEGKIQLTQGSEINNTPGAGVYSGDGVSADGWFDPAAAGLGQHQITYTFTSDNGCEDYKTQTIEVKPLPMANAGQDITILSGGEKLLDGGGSTGSNVTYKWTPSVGLSRDNIPNPLASPDADTEYTLTVTNDRGCSDIDKVFVKVLQEVKPPNTFTPNGDGINDTWDIAYLDSYPGATVEVFNRNGVRLFYSIGYAKPFDGTYNGEPLPVGVYYYVINPKNGRKNITGPLTIIR